MTTLTFYEWLKLQHRRDDPVGDLARDILRDQNHLQTSSYRSWKAYLSMHAPIFNKELVIQALDEAWQEYKSKTK